MPTRMIVTLLLIAATTISSARASQPNRGLLVRLYDIDGSMHFLPTLVSGQLPNVVKIVPTLELRTDRGDFAPFEGNFYTEVVGFLTIEQPGTCVFRLISDDGSQLWIDDRLVIDHDGLHAAEPKDGDAELAAGQHTLRVLHFESGGGEHLELQWRPPDAPKDKFELIPAELLTHAADASRETAPGTKRIIPPLRRGRPGDGTPVAGMHPGFRIETVDVSVADAAFAPPPDERSRAGPPRAVETWFPDPPHESLTCFVRYEDLSAFRDGAATEVDTYLSAQLIGGNGSNGTLHRGSLDPVPGSVNVVMFRLASGLGRDATFTSTGKDKALYCSAEPFWREDRKDVGNIQRLTRTRQVAFEMVLVRALTNGFEIEFTKPLDRRCGWDPELYYVEQWPFVLEGTEARRHEATKGTEPEPVREGTGGQAARGTRSNTARGAVAHQSEPEAQARAEQSEPGARATGRAAARAEARGSSAPASRHLPTRDGIRYPVKSASVSPDRKKVFLEISDLKSSHVVYIRLLPPCISEDGELPWSTEAWYTLNVIPQDRYGKVLTPPPPEPQNFLTEEEKAAGWKLLFDGKTTDGWHGYKKDHFPDGWIVKDACLVRVGPGGDIATDGEFDNFELKLEWRICAAGNSGIFYRVDEKYDWPFFTGPELQVLDNAEHADGRNPKTSAGSNYGLHAPARDVTEPVGFFNQVRIIADGPHVEHWLNGVKIVEYELWSDEWKELVANSKFKKWPNYGLTRKGHIVLQDHGDKVWYRNIKIRKLPGR